MATTNDPNVIESTNRQIRTIENLKQDVKKMIKGHSKKKGCDTDQYNLSESGTEGRMSLGSAAKQEAVLKEVSPNVKQPIEKLMPETVVKRKKMEITDLDSQKSNSVGKEVVYAASIVVEDSTKKRLAKKIEKANKSNQKAESELDVTLATAATMVPSKRQKVAVKEAAKENEPSKFEFNERTSLRRASTRRGGQKA